MVPIAMMMQDLDVAKDVGSAIAKVLRGTNSVIIASSDLTHYESQSSAEKKDMTVIAAVEKLDEEKLYKEVQTHRISMCGVGPTAAMLTATKLLGAKRGVLLKYATSGDITKDRSAVVGYCSMAIKRA